MIAGQYHRGNSSTTRSDRGELSQAVRDWKTGVRDRKVVRDARNVGNMRFSDAHFVRGSVIKLVTDSRIISQNYIAVTVSHGLVRDFIKPQIYGCY
jgi:hypothetical protein